MSSDFFEHFEHDLTSSASTHVLSSNSSSASVNPGGSAATENDVSLVSSGELTNTTNLNNTNTIPDDDHDDDVEEDEHYSGEYEEDEDEETEEDEEDSDVEESSSESNSTERDESEAEDAEDGEADADADDDENEAEEKATSNSVRRSAHTHAQAHTRARARNRLDPCTEEEVAAGLAKLNFPAFVRRNGARIRKLLKEILLAHVERMEALQHEAEYYRECMEQVVLHGRDTASRRGRAATAHENAQQDAQENPQENPQENATTHAKASPSRADQIRFVRHKLAHCNVRRDRLCKRISGQIQNRLMQISCRSARNRRIDPKCILESSYRRIVMVGFGNSVMMPQSSSSSACKTLPATEGAEEATMNRPTEGAANGEAEGAEEVVTESSSDAATAAAAKPSPTPYLPTLGTRSFWDERTDYRVEYAYFKGGQTFCYATVYFVV